MIINGVRWRVYFVSPAHPILLTPRHTFALGACDKRTQTIYINYTLSSQKLKEVLCHEIAHAYLFSYRGNLEQKEEESIASFISTHGEEILSWVNKIKKMGWL